MINWTFEIYFYRTLFYLFPQRKFIFIAFCIGQKYILYHRVNNHCSEMR